MTRAQLFLGLKCSFNFLENVFHFWEICFPISSAPVAKIRQGELRVDPTSKKSEIQTKKTQQKEK